MLQSRVFYLLCDVAAGGAQSTQALSGSFIRIREVGIGSVVVLHRWGFGEGGVSWSDISYLKLHDSIVVWD